MAPNRKPSNVHDMEDDFALHYVRTYPGVNSRAELSLLQTSKFSMTSFYVTSFICSSVRATLTIFSMISALAQKLTC